MKSEKCVMITNAVRQVVIGLLTERHIGRNAYKEFLVEVHQAPLQGIDGRLGAVTSAHLIEHG